MIKIISKNKKLYILVILSLIFFIRKGVQYALLGSFGPLLIVAIFLFLFLTSINHNEKKMFLVSKIWAITLIVWSIIRILISILNYITHTFDEYHLNNQFGIVRICISLIMLLIGVWIFKHSNNKNT